MGHRMRLLRRLLLLSLATLVALESTLQVGALLVSTLNAHDTDVDTADPLARTVLCVGDSFTHGMGSSTMAGSYPAQLENLLRHQLGDAWRTVNRGWPGRNSREVLELLDEQMAACRPAVLCVCVGANDAWSRPELLTLGSDPVSSPPSDGFRWRFRTARLVAWLLGKLRGGAFADPTPPPASQPPAAASPLAGTTWAAGDAWLHFGKDGRLLYGGLEFLWRADGSALTIRRLSGEESTAEWTLHDGQLTLSGPAFPSPLHLRPTRDPAAAIDPHLEGWAAWQRRDLAAAQSWFESAIDSAADGAPRSRESLAQVLMERGRRSEARAQMEWLSAEHERQPDDEDVAVALAGVMVLHGEWQHGRKLLLELTRQFPESAEVWKRYGDLAFQAGEAGTGRAALERALELAAPEHTPAIHVWLSQALVRHDARSALDHLVTYFVLTGDDRTTMRWLHQYPRPLVQEVLDSRNLDGTLRHRFESLHRAASEPADAVAEVFAAHLEQIIARAQRARCLPVLVGYPRRGALEAACRQAAARTGAAFVDVAAEFERRLLERRELELFVADGHCNDAGYGVMAAIVAERIAALVAR